MHQGSVGLAGHPALGLGPLGVLPEHQCTGVGSALMHAVLGGADALGETLVVLLGHRRYYPRFGFVPAMLLGVAPPVPDWQPNFLARRLTAYPPGIRGQFRYARAFDAAQSTAYVVPDAATSVAVLGYSRRADSRAEV